jgi:hypothetical protein
MITQMALETVIVELNEMVANRIVAKYAIGGAVGALFYLEPASTEDVDVFVVLDPDDLRLSAFMPVQSWLIERGAVYQGPYLVIDGWPVQLLPAPTPLYREAVEQASDQDINGTHCKVMTAEHLAAIALSVGRLKDKARVEAFLQTPTFAIDRFEAILSRHDLNGKWEEFRKSL